MTTTEYLEQITDIDSRCEINLAEIEKWHEIATSVSVSYDKEPVKSSGNKQRMESAAVNAVYYEQKARERYNYFMELRGKIIGEILNLGGKADYRRILYKCYVENKHLTDIASEIRYCDSHTRRLHREALKLFEKTYGKEYLNKYEQK